MWVPGEVGEVAEAEEVVVGVVIVASISFAQECLNGWFGAMSSTISFQEAIPWWWWWW